MSLHNILLKKPTNRGAAGRVSNGDKGEPKRDGNSEDEKRKGKLPKIESSCLTTLVRLC